MTELRVGMNLLWLLPGRGLGAEVYAMRVLRALVDEPTSGIELTVFVNRRLARRRPRALSRVRTAVAPVDGGFRPARIAAESTWLAREAKRRRLDLVHHMADVVPWRRSRPSVLTIHDLRALHRPDVLGTAHAAYLRARMRPSVHESAVVVTPTGTVRASVVDELGADPDRVTVVSAPVFQRPADRALPSPGVTPPFFVYPAATEPHKNHATLIRAFAKVVATRSEVRLVLTGGRGRADADVAAEIDRLGVGHAVLRLGHVPRDRLDALLTRSVALVFASTYEGFGLPLAEAMTAGCPVIASALPVVQEVVGRAGVLVDAGDADAWAAAMLRLLEDEAVRDELVVAGAEEVRRFSPQETVRGLSNAYRFAAGRG